MNNRLKLSVCVLLVAAASIIALPALVSAQSSGSSSPDGPKKIGIVNRKTVMERSAKFLAEKKKLEADLKTNQDKLDALEAEVKGLREKYDANKDTMPADQKAAMEQEINSKAISWKAEFERLQNEMDSKFAMLVNNTKDEIDAAVQDIGKSDGYDLILEGDPKSSSGVLFFASSIDMTPKVLDRMNTAK